MAMAQERAIFNRVRDIAKDLGYDTTFASEFSKPRFWPWLRETKFVPDVFLRRGGDTAIVEVKTRPVVTHDIFQMQKMREGRRMEALICVPNQAFHRIAPSVRAYAKTNNVSICRFSEIESALKELLEKSSHRTSTGKR